MKKVQIQPHLNYRMRKINFEYNSISGKFEISWYFDEEKFYMNVTIPNGVQAKIILPDGTSLDNIGKGEHHYESAVEENVYSPFTIDTPLFEILESEEAKQLLAEKVPMIYYMATGETQEMKYGTLRLLSVQPFVGISDELLQEFDEKLKKIRVSPPDDDDEQRDDTN